ncbi:MAG: hypothetical protein ACLFVU_01690 [Phycisphaerae bacterium]
MRRFLVCSLLQLSVVLFVTLSVEAETPSRKLREFTGARTRVVWVQDQSGRDGFGRGKKLRLMGLDTGDDKGERAILEDLSNYAQPLLSPAGKRVIYSDTHADKFFAVDFDGKNKRTLGDGRAAEVWRDPKTKITWVYYQHGEKTGKEYKYNPLYRKRLDGKGESEKIWDRTPLDILRFSSFQLSADGTQAGGAFPWAHCGQVDLAKQQFTKAGSGCWASLAPDNTYRLLHLDGKHQNLMIYDKPSAKPRRIFVPEAAGFHKRLEVYYPRWTSDVRFIAFTGPYRPGRGGYVGNDEGRKVEIHIAKFDADFSEISSSLQVTDNDKPDLWPDVWIAEPDTATAGFPTVQAGVNGPCPLETGLLLMLTAGSILLVWCLRRTRRTG